MKRNRARRLLVTGAAGFLGDHIVRRFSVDGWRVSGMDCVPLPEALGRVFESYHRRDLSEGNLAPVLANIAPDLVIHAAGRASVPLSIEDPSGDFYAGVAATFETLDALRKAAPQCRFILLSSAAIYGNPERLPVSELSPPSPISPYGFHKWQCEQLCVEFARIYGMRTLSVRLFSAYGEGLRRQVMWDICRKAAQSGPLCLFGRGDETRDFLHADDIARGLEIIAEKAEMVGGSINLASGEQTDIRTLARLLTGAMGIDKTPEFDGVVPKGCPARWQADVERATALGFRPRIPLEEGVRAYADWRQSEEMTA